jgi:hypothetical protein
MDKIIPLQVFHLMLIFVFNRIIEEGIQNII